MNEMLSRSPQKFPRPSRLLSAVCAALHCPCCIVYRHEQQRRTLPLNDALAPRARAHTHTRARALTQDIVGFTSLSAAVPTPVIMQMLNELFTRFDRLTEKHNVYKRVVCGEGCLQMYLQLPSPPLSRYAVRQNLCGLAFFAAFAAVWNDTVFLCSTRDSLIYTLWAF